MLKKTYTILAVALTATAATACGGTIDSSGGPLSGQCDLDALNAELSGTMLDEAVSDHEHFRCLCDADGYPLVGNINGKVITTASEFCHALRDEDLL